MTQHDLTTKTAQRFQQVIKFRKELRKEAKICSKCPDDEYCQKHAIRDAYINISEYEIINFKNELKEIHDSEECACNHNKDDKCGYGILIQEIEEQLKS